MCSIGPVFRKNVWRKRLLLAGAGCLPVVLVFVMGAAYAASPFLALASFRSAVARADRDAIDATVDFASVRASFKRQAGEALEAQTGLRPGGAAPSGWFNAQALIDRVLETAISADTLARLARYGGAGAASSKGLPEFRRTGFSGLRTFEAEFEESGVILRLQFRDFKWRITEFVIPPRAFQKGLSGLVRQVSEE